MKNFERSILIYLLDALSIAPDKANELIDIVDHKDHGIKYHFYLDKLKLSSKEDLLFVVETIRSDLR